MLPLWLLTLIALALLGWVAYCFARAHRGARILWLGRGLVVLGLIGALLRPGVGSVPTEVADESVDVLFAIDMSASSAAQDWDDGRPRFEGMMDDVEALAQQHPGARYSLVSFGSTAAQRLPFTTDATALQQAVRMMTPEDTRYSQGTSIGVAADLVEEILSSAAKEYPDRVRVVYYLGDGEHTAEEQPDSFADSAGLIEGGAVLGYGTAVGGAMLEYDRYGTTGEYVQDRSGRDAISQIEEANLEQVAAELEVPYQRRAASEPLDAAEVDPGRGQRLDGGSTQTTSFPLYWVFALFVSGWLLVEVWVLARAARELREARERIG